MNMLWRLKSAFFGTEAKGEHASRQKMVAAIFISSLLAIVVPFGLLSFSMHAWPKPGIVHAESPQVEMDNEALDRYVEHTVSAGQTLSHIALSYGATVSGLAEANDILPEGIIYPGQKLKVPDSGTIRASWYGVWFNGRRMANSRLYYTSKRVIAHRYLPLGTCVELTNPQNEKTAVGEVQDRINARYAHRWDLSPQLFTVELGINPSVGVATLEYKIVDCPLGEGSKPIALKTN